jgi:uncharacterized protein with FMN-binding domain
MPYRVARGLAATAATVAGVGALLWTKPAATPPPAAVVGGSAVRPSASPPGSPSTTGTTGSTAAAPARERRVTGDLIETPRGPVQVSATLVDGRITRIDVLVQPSGDQRHVEVNSAALPVLTERALAAQGVEIDMVSGATFTSEGYIRSLQSALDRAAG